MALVLIAMLAISISSGNGVSATSGASPGAPPDPTDFDDPLPNEYFPLEPGWAATLHGTEDGERLVEHVVVTERTKVIEGITTRVVRDVIRHRGVLVEKTADGVLALDGGHVVHPHEHTGDQPVEAVAAA
ncbi:MAG: hypothetical protein WD670_03330, partial [Actinomycetota bacterium]